MVVIEGGGGGGGGERKKREREKEREKKKHEELLLLTVDHEVPLPHSTGDVAREDLEKRRLPGPRGPHARGQPRGAALARHAAQDRVPAAADGRDVVVEVLFCVFLFRFFGII